MDKVKNISFSLLSQIYKWNIEIYNFVYSVVNLIFMIILYLSHLCCPTYAILNI